MQRLKGMEIVWRQAIIKTASAESVEVGIVDWRTDDVEHQVKDADNN